MTNPNFTDEQEAPLDPAFEKVRRKMVRLLVISSSVIILGLMAVVFSIVYRVDKATPPANPAPRPAAPRPRPQPAVPAEAEPAAEGAPAAPNGQ